MTWIQIYDTKNKLCQAKNIIYVQYFLMLMKINKNDSLTKCSALSFRDAVVKSKLNDIIDLTIVKRVSFALPDSCKASNQIITEGRHCWGSPMRKSPRSIHSLRICAISFAL